MVYLLYLSVSSAFISVNATVMLYAVCAGNILWFVQPYPRLWKSLSIWETLKLMIKYYSSFPVARSCFLRLFQNETTLYNLLECIASSLHMTFVAQYDAKYSWYHENIPSIIRLIPTLFTNRKNSSFTALIYMNNLLCTAALCWCLPQLWAFEGAISSVIRL